MKPPTVEQLEIAEAVAAKGAKTVERGDRLAVNLLASIACLLLVVTFH